MAKQQKRLGEILVDLGLVNAKEVAEALEYAKTKNLRIGEALVDLKKCPEAGVYKALATQHNMEYVDVTRDAVPPTPPRSSPRSSCAST